MHTQVTACMNFKGITVVILSTHGTEVPHGDVEEVDGRELHGLLGSLHQDVGQLQFPRVEVAPVAAVVGLEDGGVLRKHCQKSVAALLFLLYLNGYYADAHKRSEATRPSRNAC